MMELDEISSLQLEFQWLLNEEVNVILEQLKQLIIECSRRFTYDVEGFPSLIKTEKFALMSTNASHADKLKIFATVMADDITAADINIRLPKHTASSLRFFIQNDCQWKLHQIQDAANHLAAALSLLSSSPPPLRYIESENKFDFHSAEEVIQMINSIMSYLHKGRNSLIVPKTKTIDELKNSRNMKAFQPSIPNDLAVSFYIQSHKLVCAIYHQLKDAHGNLKLDMYQAETSIPWLSEVLVLFTVALQFCQQLKDKVSVFAQYKEMQIKAIP